jgi:hypothetical protein
MIKSLAGSIYIGTPAPGGSPWACLVTLSRLPGCLVPPSAWPGLVPGRPVPWPGSGGWCRGERGDPTHTRTTDNANSPTIHHPFRHRPPLLAEQEGQGQQEQVTAAYGPTALAKALVSLPLKRGHPEPLFGTGYPGHQELRSGRSGSGDGDRTRTPGRPPALEGRSVVLSVGVLCRCGICALAFWTVAHTVPNSSANGTKRRGSFS